MVLSFANINAATITSTGTGGDWSSRTTWVGGVVPANGDDVSISAGSKVIVDTNAVVGSLSIFGTLQFEVNTARSLAVMTQLTVLPGGVFRSAQSGTVKNHQLIVQGSIINSGTIDFSSGSNATGVEIVFTGSGNAIFNCSDATLTNLRQINGIVLNKGTSAISVLAFIPGNTFQVLSDGSSSAKGFLSVVNGTFNIIGSNSFTNPIFNTEGDYTIPATGGFWLGNQNATITGMNGTVTNLGDLKITNGTYLVGVSGGNSLKTINDGQFKMAGGTLNVGGNFKMDGESCTISGGRINLATLGNKVDNEPTLSISGQSRFEMYGNPTIAIAYPNSKTVPFNDIQIEDGSGLKSIAGGTIQLGTEVTPAGSFFLVNGDLVLNRLTVLNECTIHVFNTSNADLTNTPISLLPKIAFDKIAPEVTAPAKITLKCGENLPKIYSSLQEFTNAGGAATDNCTLLPASFKLTGQVQSSTNCPYTITRTYAIADVTGNVGTAEQQIVVEGEAKEPQPEVTAELPVKEEVVRLKSAMAVYTATQDGNWNDPLTWGGAGPPTSADNVNTASYTVTVNAASSCKDITIGAGGTLNHSGTNTLTVTGNWTNNGTYNGGTNGIIEFAGTNPATINGNTNFEELIISKGSLAATLTINGATTVSNGGSLTMNSGLVTIPATRSFTINPIANISIPNIAGFDVIGGTLSTTGFSITNEGLIRISSGTANLASSTGNKVHTQFDGAFVVSGGSVNIGGRLENTASGTLSPTSITSGITITGGIVTLCTAGNNASGAGSLNVTTAGNFIFTGGTLVFQRESTAGTAIDLGLLSGGGTKNTVGGTFQFGNGLTPGGTVFNISSEILLNNVTTSANADLKLITDVTIGSWALNAATTIDLNGKKIQLAVSTSGTNYTFPIINGTNSATLALNFSGITSAGTVTIASSGALPSGFLLNSGTLTTPIYITNNTVIFSTVSGSYQLPSGFTASQKVGLYNGSWSYQPAAASVNFSGWNNINGSAFALADCTAPTITGTLNVCIGLTTQLTGSDSPAASSPWISGTPSVATVDNSGLVTGVSAGTSMITYTNNAGCQQTVTVTVNALPNATLTSSDADNTFCTGTSVTFTAGGGTNYNFRVGGSSVQNGVSTTYTTSALTNTQVVDVIVTNAAGCTATSSTITNTVNPLPTASIAGTTPVCQNATAPNITFTGAVETAPYTFTYNINGGSNQTVNTAIGNSVTVSAPTGTAGTFTYNLVSVSDANSCQQNQSGTATITVNPTPTVTSPGNQTYCSGVATTAISLTGSPSGVTFDISGGASIGLADQTVPASIPVFTPSAGTATVTITPKANGCTGTPIEFLVTVNSIPVISSCPSPISVSAVAGTCSATATYTVSATGLPAATFTYTFTGATSGSGNGTGTGSSFNVGVTQVEVSASNSCGSVKCTFTVTITDNEKPVVTCPAAITQNVNAGTCGKVVTYTAPVGTDNCSGATTTQIAGLASGATFPVGITTNTFVVTDAAGNTATCSFTVTITDNEAPVISGCPTSTITVNTGPGRTTCNQTASWTEPTATDACNGVLTYSTRSHAPGALFNVGTTTVTYTFKDTSGNTSTCTLAVTVVDNTPPTFIVPAATTISTDVNCNIDKTPAQTGSPINLFDNCTATPTLANNVSISDGSIVPVSATCTSSYSFTRSWGVTDTAGNTTTQTQLITVVDNVAPTITVPTDKTVQCGFPNLILPSATGTATATDNCGGSVSITFTDATTITGTCSYGITRTWRATDGCNNFSTGTQIINVSDSEKPTVKDARNPLLSYPAIINVATTNDIPVVSSHIATYFLARDNCTVSPTIEFVSESFGFPPNVTGFCPTTVTRTFRASDDCGNIFNFTSVIQAASVGTCSNCQSDVPAFPIDLSSSPSASYTTPPISRKNKGYCWCGVAKDDECAAFNIILHPETVSLRIYVDGANPSPKPRIIDCIPIIMDNREICKKINGETHLFFTYCKDGGNKNTFTFTAVSGATVTATNTISTRVECNQILSVSGVTSPTWSVAEPADPTGEYLSYLSCTSCVTPTFTARTGSPAEIKYKVCGNLISDPCGVSTDCSTVTVFVKPAINLTLDINPDLICINTPTTITPAITPAGTYRLDWKSPSGVITPNTFSYTTGGTESGTYTVTVTDMQGGVPCSSKDFPFTLKFDQTGPNFTVTEPPLRIQCNESGYVNTINVWRSKFKATYTNAQGNTVTATVTDDFDFSKLNMTCGNVVTVTFTAPDQCVNYSTATSTITVYDDIVPTITTAAQNMTVECDGSGNTAALNAWLASNGGGISADDCGTVSWTTNYTALSDLCGMTGQATVTFTATDQCGNAVSTTATFSIIDTTSPTITCPGPYYQNANAGTCIAFPVNFGTATATDSCGGTLSATNNAPAQFPVGVTTITWTVTDPCGNVATCEQYVTIYDIQAPVIDCTTTVINATVGPGQCSVPVGLVTPTYTENCNANGLPTVTVSRSDGLPASANFPVGTTTVVWTVTDIYNNFATCTQTVIVTDTNVLGITCPSIITTTANNGVNYASPVAVGTPTVQPNCFNPQLSWVMVPPVDNSVVPVVDYATMYTPAQLAGNGIFVGTGTYYVGVTTITYTVTDTKGTTASCSFTVTVTSAPQIKCADSFTHDADSGTCSHTVDPGVPTLLEGAQPITWTYTITGPGNIVEQTGTFTTTVLNPTITPIGPYPFKTGTTSITWTATNISGSDACTQTVTVIDTQPPTYNPSPVAVEFCVESLFSATYSSTVASNLVLNPDPDYFLFRKLDPSLDLIQANFVDNCCAASANLLIRWTIVFYPDPAPPYNSLTGQVVSGVGQPSAHTADIPLWGDGVTFLPVNHEIRYWIKDCYGNETVAPIVRSITIKPRPKITKMP